MSILEVSCSVELSIKSVITSEPDCFACFPVWLCLSALWYLSLTVAWIGLLFVIVAL